MSRPLITVVIVLAVAFGTIGANAQPSAPQTQTQSAVPTKNAPPLKPAGAARIHEAQRASDRGVLIASGLILAGIVAALLLVDTDDDDSVTTTGSNS